MAARNIAAGLMLAGLCLFAFGGALHCGFVRFDDHEYVFENARVVAGLTSGGLRWAFTTGYAANWHPLTWISHMADVELYGLEAAGHHATSLLLHALNSILCFGAIRRLTSRFYPALLLAMLWAVHPLRVESVVWITERKDVLSMFFGLLALWAYGRPAVRGRMAWVALGYALSLMSKSLWVTFPFLLLLLDVWPLKRWPGIPAWALIREKWPLFLLAAVSCAITLGVQQASGAVRSCEDYPLGARLANAAVAYVEYVRFLFWPFNLSVFYPHPGRGLPTSLLGGSVAVLFLLTLLAALGARRRPWWLVGWLWFLGTLMPMIGLVQVGGQAFADRYTYLPHIGLLMALVWGGLEAAEAVLKQPRMAAHARRVRLGLAVPTGLLAIGLALISRQQTLAWRDTETLYLHALEGKEDNAIVHGNLGSWYAAVGRHEEALRHLTRSLELQPRNNSARYDLAKLCLRLGRRTEAIGHYRMALQDFPRHVTSLNNLAWLLASDPEASRAQAEEALSLAKRAVESVPEPAAMLLDTLAAAQAACGDFDAAAATVRDALALAEDREKAPLRQKLLSRLRDYEAGRKAAE